MFAAEACVHGVGGVFLSEEELGPGDSDLDLRLELGIGRCFRIFAETQSRVLLFPDLLSLLLDILLLLPTMFLGPPPEH